MDRYYNQTTFKGVLMKHLVVFKATWCGPCQSLAMIMKDLELPVAQVKTIDIDEDMEAAREFAVRGVPTVLLMEDNQVIKRSSGAMTASQLQEFCS
jgi:thioredoxin 1